MSTDRSVPPSDDDSDTFDHLADEYEDLLEDLVENADDRVLREFARLVLEKGGKR